MLRAIGCWKTVVAVLILATNTGFGRCDGREDTHDTSSKPPLPNFVVLFMDDLGYGDLGFTGHPTTKTPHLDKAAMQGKILTSWYSACHVCTGSRASLLTGRQFLRTGLPGVLFPTATIGLPLNETTIAEHLSYEAGYATAAVGKWHLGQRQVYLPANRGFDSYLGIPYSDDMGSGYASPCSEADDHDDDGDESSTETRSTTSDDSTSDDVYSTGGRSWYESMGFLEANVEEDDRAGGGSSWGGTGGDDDPAAKWLPLVFQEKQTPGDKNSIVSTKVWQQPTDFSHLAEKYNQFATRFITEQAAQHNPFFLYVPFSHVHVTNGRESSEGQYAGCSFQNTTTRGRFGDALAEADWIVGNIMDTLKEQNLEEKTLVFFTSDNGPWLSHGLSAGSEGLFTGRYAGYYDTGKGTTWEGGIRMPAFALWKGKIEPFSRSSITVSTLDVFPTLLALAGIPLPADRVYDGKDMSEVLFGNAAKSAHDFLFFYSNCPLKQYWSVSSVRHGKYKAHWCTAPGVVTGKNETVSYHPYPLLFDIEKDPSEAYPISTGNMPTDPPDQAAMNRIMRAYAMEKATFTFGKVIPEPDGPGEGPGKYGVCCDRSKDCHCRAENNKEDEMEMISALLQHVEPIRLLDIGTKEHHDRYHEALGEHQPWPPRTKAQKELLMQRQADHTDAGAAG